VQSSSNGSSVVTVATVAQAANANNEEQTKNENQKGENEETENLKTHACSSRKNEIMRRQKGCEMMVKVEKRTGNGEVRWRTQVKKENARAREQDEETQHEMTVVYPRWWRTVKVENR
jgi:hypothetical protein